MGKTMNEPIKTVKHGKPCLDYGTRTVPDDEYNGLKIGYGWRKHWTILCGVCSTPSPYVLGLKSSSVNAPDGMLIQEDWTFQCPKCGQQWESRDQYYDDED